MTRNLTSQVVYGDHRMPWYFWERVIPEPNSGCWLWLGALCRHGYGRFLCRESDRNEITTTLAHRRLFVATTGLAVDGLDLDHLCRTRSCVNPQHLEPVTHAENVRRGSSAEQSRLRVATLTHCKRGHAFTDHARIAMNRGGMVRQCRLCERIRANTPRAKALKAAWQVRSRAEAKGLKASAVAP